jgi:DeoR family transcriptional regulator, glycerol-3-phosphate regulon repressor
MTRPLAARRQNEIVSLLRMSESVTVGDLAQAFGVSHETIRRDLKALAGDGHLELVHGGAVRRGARPVEPAADENSAGNAAIARAAAALVSNGATVLLDAGGTTAAIARELLARSDLTVCTNSPSHALLLCRSSRVFLLGGEVDPTREASFGPDAIAAVGNFRIDVAFIVVDGFAEDGGATDLSREVAELHGRMLLCGRAYVVAEQSKFARRTPFRIAHFDRIAGLIVDQPPEAALADAWAQSAVNVMVAHQNGDHLVDRASGISS